MSNQRERTFDAGFEFARRLKDAEFRQFLKASGWQSGQHTVMATDDTAIRDIMAKMMLHDLEAGALIAVVHDDAPHGFRLITVEVLPPWRMRRKPRGAIRVSLDSTIGMLLATTEQCPAYLPSEFARDLLFDSVAA